MLPKVLHTHYGGAGKAFDGPGYVHTIIVASDGNGAAVAEFKTAVGGATLFTVRALDGSSQVIHFGDYPFPVAPDTEFYVAVTNCNVLVMYED